MAAAGMLLIIVGIVLHVVATSRRRRVDREYPYRSRGWVLAKKWPIRQALAALG
jgi:uncharacterized membrane protein YidH (DUF202 family)